MSQKFHDDVAMAFIKKCSTFGKDVNLDAGEVDPILEARRLDTLTFAAQ